MKKFVNFDFSRRVSHLRIVIACILIAAVCVSLTVGMGYSRLVSLSQSSSSDYEAPVLNVTDEAEYYSAIQRNTEDSTVLVSADGKVTVTIPKTGVSSYLEDDTVFDQEEPLYYVLYAKKLDESHDDSTDEDMLSYDIRLFAVYDDASHNGYAYSEDGEIELSIEIPDGDMSSYYDVYDANKGPLSYDSAKHSFVYLCEMIREDQNVDITYMRDPVGSTVDPSENNSTPNEY